MPGSITREFLRKRYWTAKIAILAALLLCIIGGWSVVDSLQSDAHFARAFSQLTEATHHLRAEVQRAVNRSNESGSDAGQGPTSGKSDLVQAFEELVIVFTAIRNADPDGVSEIDDDAETDSEEAHWDLLAHRMFENLDEEISHVNLAGQEMPDSLAMIWEDGVGDEGPELEELIGEVLELAAVIVEAEVQSSPASREAAGALEDLVSAEISPVFHTIAPIIDDELTSGASLILYILFATAFAIVCALIFNTLVIFAPLEKAVVESQQAITQERDRAIAAEEAKRSFLAVMSHELRTPMNGIMGFANLLMRSDLEEKQKDYAETIYTSGEALLGLLNDILDISKIEAGSLELEETDFDLRDVVKSVVNLMGPRAYTNRLELSTYIDPGLPRCLNGDAGRVRQILLNLVGNAIKFTPSGAIAIEVTENGESREDARDIRITVTDTGVGIPPEKLDDIFKRFVQVDDGSDRKYEGSGLGLAICKKLAAMMGGQIGVESTPDQGSSFWVTIRLGEADSTARRVVEATPEELTGRRVLVVDDNALNRRIFKLQLQSHAVLAELASDGRSAMKLLTEAQERGAAFELAIIDHMMPETDGLALAKLIRAEPKLRDMKLILSSSSGMTTDQQARVLGFDASCPKPVHQDKVLRIMQRLLSADEPHADEPGAYRPGAHGPGASAPDADASLKPPTPAAPASNFIGSDRQGDAAQRILIVEDNATNQRLAMTVLTAAGYAVDAVADGSEAVRAVQTLPYDLILMDIRMPVMGGVEATKRIRALDLPVANCPILAMTANAIRGDREEYLAAGMNDYISKPIDIHGLVQKVEEHIGTARKTRESGTRSEELSATKTWA
ncbi:hybrid sensor histidine kinase/response regulator [Denitrobaculum tricleocarpae]|nr:response regulator [Denitrobaculum tricleocarpae]